MTRQSFEFTSFQHERLSAEILSPRDLARFVIEACNRIRSAGATHPPGIGVLMEAALRYVEQIDDAARPVPGYAAWLSQELEDSEGCGELIPHDQVVKEVMAVIAEIKQAGPGARGPYTLDDLGRPPGARGL